MTSNVIEKDGIKMFYNSEDDVIKTIYPDGKVEYYIDSTNSIGCIEQANGEIIFFNETDFI